MSSQSSFVSVPSGQAEDAVTDNYTMSIVGARYEAAPNTVADGQIRGFQIDSQGRLILNGPTAENNAFTARPITIGGVYNGTLPTYDSGDVTALQTNANGLLLTYDDAVYDILNSTDFATEATLNALVTAFSGTDFATETTLAAVLAAVDGLEGSVDGLEALLTSLDGKDFASETTLAAVESAVDGIEGSLTTLLTAVKSEDAAAASGEAGIPALAVRQDTLASANADGDYGHIKTDALGRVYVNTKDSLLSVVDFIDASVGPVLDAASDNIPASASSPLSVVATLASAAKKIRVADTTGEFIGLYSDPAGTPVLEAIINPGMDGEMEIRLAAGVALGLRNMANTAITVGQVSIHFLG